MLVLVVMLSISCSQLHGKVVIPFGEVLLQEPAFEFAPGSTMGDGQPPITSSVPLVMRILFQEADRLAERKDLPQGGDFQSLARSVLPTKIQQLGLQRFVLEFPEQSAKDLWPGADTWLVLQLRESYLLGNNCSQVLTVYENDQNMRPVVSVPLNYKTEHPLLAINVTGSSRTNYVVVIKDSTSYTRDRRLYSFANYIDCILARANEVIAFNGRQTSPVLLHLSPELPAEKLLGSKAKSRSRRSVENELDQNNDEDESNEIEKNLCKMVNWEVNVEQLGWDWLIYPERIPLNLCVGSCPVLLDRTFNATSHAVARGLLRLVLGEEAKPENTAPCCVPVRYRRFTMLIEKSPGVISLETSSDLSASRCGCR